MSERVDCGVILVFSSLAEEGVPWGGTVGGSPHAGSVVDRPPEGRSGRSGEGATLRGGTLLATSTSEDGRLRTGTGWREVSPEPSSLCTCGRLTQWQTHHHKSKQDDQPSRGWEKGVPLLVQVLEADVGHLTCLWLGHDQLRQQSRLDWASQRGCVVRGVEVGDQQGQFLLGQGAGEGHLQVRVVLLRWGFWVNERDEIGGREGVELGTGDGDGIRATHLHVRQPGHIPNKSALSNNKHKTIHTSHVFNACHSKLQMNYGQTGQRMLATRT